MKNWRHGIFYIFFLFLGNFAIAEDAFTVIVLGAGGGPCEGDLSGYLLGPKEGNDFIALDAGSLLRGIKVACDLGSFGKVGIDAKSPYTQETEILRHHVKGYLISHAHLDHIAGLVLNSPDDTSKPIFAIDSVINFLRDYIFNGKIWPNFGSEGNKPCLDLYTYKRLPIGEKVCLTEMDMQVETFLLSHPHCYQSSAFLLEHKGMYVVYFGDTAPDALEKTAHIHAVWEKLAPLVKEKKLRGVFLECSFLERPDAQLFGHLDVKYMMQELRVFATLVDPIHPEKALEGLKVLVTHMKDPLTKDRAFREEIAEKLQQSNDLGIEFLFPGQGQKIVL